MAENQNLHDKIISKIKEVYDPEIPVDIYELGLIYDVQITERNEVVVLMTLTAPNCPEAGVLPQQVESKVQELADITDAKVVLTFDPPWHKDLMSEEAKLELGMY